MEKKKKSFAVEVREDRCKACGYCRSECPRQVFDQPGHTNKDGYVVMAAVAQDKCIGCVTCVQICPDFAITVQELSAQ